MPFGIECCRSEWNTKERHKAATRVQKTTRGRTARKTQVQRSTLAVRIQTRWRGHSRRTSATSRQPPRVAEVEESAAGKEAPVLLPKRNEKPGVSWTDGRGGEMSMARATDYRM